MVDNTKFKQQSEYENWKDMIQKIKTKSSIPKTLTKSVLKDLADVHFDKNLKNIFC